MTDPDKLFFISDTTLCYLIKLHQQTQSAKIKYFDAHLMDMPTGLCVSGYGTNKNAVLNKLKVKLKKKVKDNG